MNCVKRQKTTTKRHMSIIRHNNETTTRTRASPALRGFNQRKLLQTELRSSLSLTHCESAAASAAWTTTPASYRRRCSVSVRNMLQIAGPTNTSESHDYTPTGKEASVCRTGRAKCLGREECVCVDSVEQANEIDSLGLEKNVWVSFKGLSDRVMWLNKRSNPN